MKHWIVLALLLAAFAALAGRQVSDSPWAYDEADYMFAASRGLWANLTDTPTLTIAEFAHLGFTRGLEHGSRADLSERIRTGNDIVFYRHWHGPLYFYWLIAISHFTSDEQTIRALGLIFPALGALLIYWACLRLAGSPAAILATALYLSSDAVVRSSELAPHQLFALCSLAALFLLASMMKTGERRWWYGAVVCCALAACTLEVAFVTVITAMICGHLKRRELSADLPFALKSIALFLGTLLVVWPAALLKLSIVKAYAFMAWLALFRAHAWGTNLGVWQVWLKRLETAPFEWMLVVIGAIIFLGMPAAERRTLLPFALFGVLMVAAVFRVNGDAARYTLPFLPALDVLAGTTLGWYLASMSRTRGAAITAILCLALFCGRAYESRSRPGTDFHAEEMLAWMRDHNLERSRVLAPQGDLPTLHYYFPNAVITGYFDESSFTAARAHGGFAAVLLPGAPLRYQLNPQP